LGGAAALAAAAAGGLELVSRGDLPGTAELDRLDGACSVATTHLDIAATGPSYSGQFFSTARRRDVGYTIGYPPGHDAGAELPLIVMLHGFGGDHAHALAGMSPAQALALETDGRPLAPMALVTVDGGNGYWNPHPDDNPLAMVWQELIPLCRRRGLGRRSLGLMGISMGGYGALLMAERHPRRVRAVAAISPAIWTTYAEARSVNPGAYASAGAFAADDDVTHTGDLTGVAIRIASGASDPFHSGVEAIARVLPAGSEVTYPAGCHTAPFFVSQEPPSLRFLAAHLTD
jgi:S-formylglutathione hydrolase FrmB